MEVVCLVLVPYISLLYVSTILTYFLGLTFLHLIKHLHVLTCVGSAIRCLSVCIRNPKIHVSGPLTTLGLQSSYQQI